METQPTI